MFVYFLLLIYSFALTPAVAPNYGIHGNLSANVGDQPMPNFPQVYPSEVVYGYPAMNVWPQGMNSFGGDLSVNAQSIYNVGDQPMPNFSYPAPSYFHSHDNVGFQHQQPTVPQPSSNDASESRAKLNAAADPFNPNCESDNYEYGPEEKFEIGDYVQIGNSKNEEYNSKRKNSKRKNPKRKNSKGNKSFRKNSVKDKIWIEAQVIGIFTKEYKVKIIQDGKKVEKEIRYPGFIRKLDGTPSDDFEEGEEVQVVQVVGNDRDKDEWVNSEVTRVQDTKVYQVKVLDYCAVKDKMFVRDPERVRRYKNANTIDTFKIGEEVEMLMYRKENGEELWIKATVSGIVNDVQYKIKLDQHLLDDMEIKEKKIVEHYWELYGKLRYPFALRKV